MQGVQRSEKPVILREFCTNLISIIFFSMKALQFQITQFFFHDIAGHLVLPVRFLWDEPLCMFSFYTLTEYNS